MYGGKASMVLDRQNMLLPPLFPVNRQNEHGIDPAQKRLARKRAIPVLEADFSCINYYRFPASGGTDQRVIAPSDRVYRQLTR